MDSKSNSVGKPYPIFTIGYGSKSMESFLFLLKKYNISFLIDIRSNPYSKFRSEFDRESLRITLQREGIVYGFFGDSLGGKPSKPSLYTDDGKADYTAMSEDVIFKTGISRLQNAVDKGLVLCLMCSEEKPEMCHRSKLVGRHLLENNQLVLHILENGKAETQAEVFVKASKGYSPIDLFGNPVAATSRGKFGPKKGDASHD